SLNNNKKPFTIKVLEEDRGGFGINEFFVKNNRFYTVTNTVKVPWSNKELNISFDTWRDKTLPGSEEKWTVKISGNKGEKVGAEMLASMYDASLDQFKPHSWNDLSSIWPTYNGYNNWEGTQNFTTIESSEKYWNEPYLQGPVRQYDALNYLPNPYRLVIRGMTTVQANSQISPSSMHKQNRESDTSIKSGEALNEIISVMASVPSIEIENEDMSLPSIDQSQIQIRKNFNETAFFFPELRTDKEGNIQFSFTMPEALT